MDRHPALPPGRVGVGWAVLLAHQLSMPVRQAHRPAQLQEGRGELASLRATLRDAQCGVDTGCAGLALLSLLWPWLCCLVPGVHSLYL